MKILSSFIHYNGHNTLIIIMYIILGEFNKMVSK